MIREGPRRKRGWKREQVPLLTTLFFCNFYFYNQDSVFYHRSDDCVNCDLRSAYKQRLLRITGSTGVSIIPLILCYFVSLHETPLSANFKLLSHATSE